MQTNLILKKRLRLHSGPSLKDQLQLHSCFRNSLRFRAESTPTLRLLYTSQRFVVFVSSFDLLTQVCKSNFLDPL